MFSSFDFFLRLDFFFPKHTSTYIDIMANIKSKTFWTLSTLEVEQSEMTSGNSLAWSSPLL